MKGGHNKGNPELVKYLTQNSMKSVEWLESMGVKFKDEIGGYTGLSGYKKAYEKQINQLDKKAGDVKEIEKSIYANVLAILAVFVAIFSLISTNVKLLEDESTLRSFIGYNLITVGGISFLLTLLRTTILNDLSRKKPVKGFFVWLPTIVVFIAALLVFLLVK